jgi:integrase
MTPLRLQFEVVISMAGGQPTVLVATPMEGLTMRETLSAPAITWGELIEKYLAWGREQGGKGGGSWNTIHEGQAAYRLGWWGERLAFILPNAIRLEQIDQFMPKVPGRTVKGKVLPSSPKTKRDYVRMLLAFRRWCHVRQLARRSDPDPLEAQRTPNGEPEMEYRALSIDEFKALLRVAPSNRRELYIILALTGLRIGQLQKVRKSWVDLEARCIHSPRLAVKKRKRVVTAMSPAVTDYFRARMEGKGDEDLLFKFSQNFLNRKFHQDLKEAGISLFTPEGKAALHGMRDTASTVLQEECGFSLSAASKFLDHGDERITRRSYTSIDLKRKHEAAGALEGALVEGSNPAAQSGEGLIQSGQRAPWANNPQRYDLAEVGAAIMERVKGIEPSIRHHVTVNINLPNGLSDSEQADARIIAERIGEYIYALLSLPQAAQMGAHAAALLTLSESAAAKKEDANV